MDDLSKLTVAELVSAIDRHLLLAVSRADAEPAAQIHRRSSRMLSSFACMNGRCCSSAGSARCHALCMPV